MTVLTIYRSISVRVVEMLYHINQFSSKVGYTDGELELRLCCIGNIITYDVTLHQHIGISFIRVVTVSYTWQYFGLLQRIVLDGVE